jgi:homoserine O-succinyltransferase/O-acetyltransferase
MKSEFVLKVAVLDLYNGVENQGMRCIREILEKDDSRYGNVQIKYDVFDVRGKSQIPGLEYDLYISSGGPGSPYDGEGQDWEPKYFAWMDAVWNYNLSAERKKFVLMICHSFQLMARHFELAEVVKRKSDSFGIMPVHLTEAGINDPIFAHFPETFYGADFREWQVLQPNTTNLHSLGAKILAIEKERPHVPLERAVMAVRVSPEIVGTQFHPEADPEGMLHHFTHDQQKEKITRKHGEQKFNQTVKRLKHPHYLLPTYLNFIPNFLRIAMDSIFEVEKVG